jgi:hypothetical protein
MSSFLRATRRQFVTGAAMAGTLVAGTATGGNSFGSQEDAAQQASVVLHDRRIEIESALRDRLTAGGARFIELTDDPVRQWRSEISALLTHPDTRLFGITQWSDYLIVRGMAAETRRHVRHESRASGDGVLTWLIA